MSDCHLQACDQGDSQTGLHEGVDGLPLHRVLDCPPREPCRGAQAEHGHERLPTLFCGTRCALRMVHPQGDMPWGAGEQLLADLVLQAADLLAQRRLGDARAGGRVAEVVRVHPLLPDREDFEPCWPVLRRCFGDVRPAATMLVCGLSDPRMKIEIEVDAWRRFPPRGDVPSNRPKASAVPVEAHEPPYYAAVFTTVRTQNQSDYSETKEWRTEVDRREDPCR